MVERAIVERYFRDPNRLYGFARLLDANRRETNVEFFFHIEELRPIKIHQGRLILGKGKDSLEPDDPTRNRIPRIGQQIVCVTERARRGLRAKRWTFADVWDRYERALRDDLPNLGHSAAVDATRVLAASRS